MVLIMADTIVLMSEGWVTAGGDGLTDEERTDFYKALSSITENLRSRIEAEARQI